MKNAEKLLFAILLTGHGLFFFYRLTHRPVHLTDSEDYLIAAENLREHATFYCQLFSDPLSIEAYTRRPPLYPLLISGISVFQSNESIILLIQNLLSLLNFFLLFRFLRKHFPETGKKLYLLIPFMLFYPAQAIYANLVMAEMTLQTFIFLFFLSSYEFLKSKQVRYLYFAACWLIAGILTKPVLVYFSGIFLAAAIFYFFKTLQRQLLFAGALPLLAIISYNTWNYSRTGYFHFSSIKETNLLYYNTALFLQKKEGLFYADSVVKAIEQKAAMQPTFEKKQQFISEETNKILLSDLFRYGLFHGTGMLNFFLDPGRFDLYTFFKLQEQDQPGLLSYFSAEGYKGILSYLKQQPVFLVLLLLLTALFNAIRLLAFTWFIFYREIDLKLRILLGLIVCYVAFMTGPLGASRFLVPVYPLMLLSVPVCWSWLETKWLNRKQV